ncbi:MAG: glycosyltransferase [bacterium]|nr:glycosyltransferase [bacterium]
MTILYVVPFANIRVKQFAEYIERLGNRVIVVDVSHCWVAENSIAEGKYFAGKNNQQQIRYIEPPFQFTNLALKVLCSIPRIIFYLYRIIQHDNIDVVIAYNPAIYTALPVWLACLLKKIPWYIYYVELVGYAPTGMRFRKWFEKFIVRRANYVISLTECWKSYISQNWNIAPERIFVLRLAIDIKAFDREIINIEKYQQLYGITSENKVLVNAGTTYPVKTKQGIYDLQDVATLIRGLPIIHRKYPQTKLILLGIGHDQSIIGLVKELNLEKQVVIVGRFMFWEEQHLSTLAMADILCLPSSDAEAMRYFSKYKALDYMAAKRPIVASGTLSLQETLKDSAIYYIPHRPDSFAEKVIYCFEHPEETQIQVEKAYQILLTEHLWEIESKRLIAFLQQHIQQNHQIE